jgi:hypothetical protein
MLPVPKRGSEDEAIGRSRGGLSTKINIGLDALGNPVRFILTAGNVNDICQAEGLISGVSFDNLLADMGWTPAAFAPLWPKSHLSCGSFHPYPSRLSRSLRC